MPIDTPDAPTTTRRTFLVRAALGGALVGIGTAVGPLTGLLPVAGAQEADDALTSPSDLDEPMFAAGASSLELGAVAAYQAAASGSLFDEVWLGRLTFIQHHHQTVADALAAAKPDGATIEPDATILAGTVAAVSGAADRATALGALAELESVLAATHLYAIGGLEDEVLAKTLAQALAIESQQAVVLGLGADQDPASLTPDLVGTAEARTDLGAAGVHLAPDEDASSTTAAESTTTTTDATTTTEGGN